MNEKTPKPTPTARFMARAANCCFLFCAAVLLLLLAFGNPDTPEIVSEAAFFLILLSFLGGCLFAFLQLIWACFRANRSLFWGGVGKLFPILLGIGLLLPSINCARGPAFRMERDNQLKQLQLALWNYSEAHERQLPPHRTGNGPDENGIFPHSWRVHILPWIEQKELYEKIRLNEPWDSEWNRQFHDQMPSVFWSPFFSTSGMRYADVQETQPKRSSETSFCVVTGPGELFPENGEGPSVKELERNGEAPRILVAESVPGCWMDPAHDISMEDVRKNGLDAPKGFRAYYQKRFALGLEPWKFESLNFSVVLSADREELEEFLRTRQLPSR